MMIASDLKSSLKQALENEIKLLTDFNDVLNQESELLLHGQDNDAITQLSAQKIQYVDALAQADSLRASALKRLNHTNSTTGLKMAVQQDVTLEPLVDELFRLAEQAKTQNESNGILIHTYLQHNEEALEALAQLMQPVEKVYNARGKASVQRSYNRPSIKA